MSFLSRTKKLTATDPPRILIYGEAGIGKTSLAAEFPHPYYLMIENGQNDTLENLGVEGLDRREVQTFGDVCEVMRELYETETHHRTFVLDSLSALQTMIYEEVCARGDEHGNPRNRIQDFKYGNGYVNAMNVWIEFVTCMDMLRLDRGMTIVLIAHANITRFDDPETVSYSKYELDLHHSEKVSARKLIEKEMDAILLLKKDVSTKQENPNVKGGRVIPESANIFIHAQSKAAFIAKSRYGIPAKLVYRPGNGYAELAKYLPGHTVPAQPAADAAK